MSKINLNRSYAFEFSNRTKKSSFFSLLSKCAIILDLTAALFGEENGGYIVNLGFALRGYSKLKLLIFFGHGVEVERK